METNNRVYSVHDVSLMAKNAIERVPGFDRIAIRGELADVSVGRGGHQFFSLKQGDDRIPGIIWPERLANLLANGVVIENGRDVVCLGKMTTYSVKGTYQLQCNNVLMQGEALAAQQLEELKRRLNREHLFEQQRPLPKFPKKIAVVTSRDGAVIHDITTTVERRYPLTEIVLIDAGVQGAAAIPSLISGVQRAQTTGADILIIARGGGSTGDLDCFNDEELARTIYRSQIPTICAVGHAVNKSIADEVADWSDVTPTAAAERATTPDITTIKGVINGYDATANCALKQAVLRSENSLLALSNKVQRLSPRGRINAWSANLDAIQTRVKTLILQRLTKAEHDLGIKVNTISGVNPLAVLSRGYSVAMRDGKAVKSSAELAVGDTLEIKLNEGEISAQVTKIH